MKPRILIASLAAMAASGCVFHHEVKSAPERDRMEFAAQAEAPIAKAAHANSTETHD